MGYKGIKKRYLIVDKNTLYPKKTKFLSAIKYLFLILERKYMIEKFTFYKNYFEILRYLPDKDRLKMYDAILNYMFEQTEPELKELLKGIWINIKMPLDTNLKNINNGIKGGRPNAKPKDNPSNNPKETQVITQEEPKAKANNISYFLFLISNNKYININSNKELIEEIKQWLEYKQQRKEKYTNIGLEKLLSQIENKTKEYEVNDIIRLIDECISNNYKGIIFDKLIKKQNNIQTSKTNVPWWMNATQEELSKGITQEEYERKKT